MTEKRQRSSHALMDQDSRVQKAEKIVRLLAAERPLDGLDVLEIGAGAGYTAVQLAAVAGAVSAVDVSDQRLMSEGYAYQTVPGTTLPFPDDSFDVVVSNHVIEHVGDGGDQTAHVGEISRVLRPDGVVYLATPNRWQLVENHYRLPLLSWLPTPFRSPFVRMTRRGEWFDVEPLDRKGIRRLLKGAGLTSEERTFEAMEVMADVESLSSAQRMVLSLPSPVLRVLGSIIPSLIYVARPFGPGR